MNDKGYALIAVMLWATVATAFKISLRYLSPIQLLFYSSLFSLLSLFSILVFQGKVGKLKNWNIKPSLIMGFLNPFLYYLILFSAYDMVPAQIAQPLNYTWPLMLTLFSLLILKQKIGMRNIFGLLISFSGVTVVSLQGRFHFHFNAGIFLALFSSIIWALYWILNVKDERDAIAKLFMNFLFGFLFISPLSILYGLKFNLIGITTSLYIGLFEMSITFLIWFKALEKSENFARTSNFIYLSPFISLVFIHFILGETIYLSTLIGLLLIIAGIIINQKED